VQAALDQLSETAAQCTPDQFADAYLSFTLKVQAHLGETGEAPVAG